MVERGGDAASATPVVHDHDRAVAVILGAIAAGAPSQPIVLIDGPSGAGKSTLADALIVAWPQAQLLRMDAIVPGWDGLADSSDALERILAEHLAGDGARWRAWDWSAEAPGATSILDPRRPLVVEGSGSVTGRSAAAATFTVWVALDDDAERYRRAIDRDGAAYEPHWDRWAAQELVHAARHRPRDRADLIVDRTR